MVSSRALLIILNCLFFLMGVGVLTLGLWSQFDSNFSKMWNSSELSKLIDARGLYGASLVLIVSGFMSVFLSFVGLYGSVRKDKCFLTVYCIAIFIILVLEVAAISVFFTYQSESRTHLRQSLNETVEKINRDNDKAALQIMNSVQTVFKCCGCDGPSDYLNLTLIDSCRSSAASADVFQNGCYPTIISYVNSHLPVLLGIGICIMIFQAFCLLISVNTCCAKRPEGYEDI
jgi:hypothetical protein